MNQPWNEKLGLQGFYYNSPKHHSFSRLNLTQKVYAKMKTTKGGEKGGKRKIHASFRLSDGLDGISTRETGSNNTQESLCKLL